MNSQTKPFLRWPGGKRWLAPEIKKLISSIRFNQYFEPFLGGGALFFEISPQNAILGDLNSELVNTYIQIRDNTDIVLTRLKKLKVSKRDYYHIRESTPKCPIDQAVRFIYLNRTSFSGMYRVNKQGQFNVPYGGGQRNTDLLLDGFILQKAKNALAKATIFASDFEDTLSSVSKNDLVYCDPTYTVLHNNNSFIRYNENNFSWADQQRLSGICESLSLKGATVLVSNAYHKEVIKLYPKAKLLSFERKSLLCPNSSKRKTTKEALFSLGLPSSD